MEIVEFDLKRMAQEMGLHFRQVPASEHTNYCPYCDAEITQFMSECPNPECGRPVVWHHSKAWKNLYGSPTHKVRTLRAIMPSDAAGKYLMARAKQPGFKNKNEAERWESAAAVLSQEVLRGTVEYCARNTSGRGLIKYALNVATKHAGDMPAASEEESKSYSI